MLELILGTDLTANTDEVLARIAHGVHQRQGGQILLVPDSISHHMERHLGAVAGDTASRYAEVLSFTRLARRVSDAVSHAPLDCLDNGGRTAAMAAAARQLHSRLKAYAAVQTRPEFLTQLLDAVDEFKRCCISAQDLLAASAQAEGALAQKLEELSLLLEAYDALCQQGKRDPRDVMNWVLDELEDSDFAQGRVFYIDGFPDLTRQNMAIVEHLICHSPQVTVSLNCDRPGSKLMAFEKAGETAAELVKLAKKHDIDLKITTVAPKPGALSGVRERLFQGAIQPDPALEGVLRLRQADTVYQECQAAAVDILDLVRQGCRYRDISIVCAQMAAYRPVLSLVFRRAGIPVYLSGTEAVRDKGAMVTVTAALEAALDGFEQKAVLRYLRSVLSPLDPELCDNVENYAVVWGITGNDWKQEWTHHPDGLSDDMPPWARAKLERLEQARQRAMEPLIRLQASFREATKLSQQVQALYRFLEDIRYPQRLDALAGEMERQGDGRSAQILNQLWEILICALEQLHDVLGETAWESTVFQQLFCLLLDQYDVGTIPTVLDSVTVGPVSAMQGQRSEHLFILGANEGSLPGYGGTKGVLTDQERDVLRSLEVPLTGGALGGIQTEFAGVYGLFCGASQTVTVSYAQDEPSYVYRRLRDMAGREETAKDQTVTADPFEAACVLAQWDAQASAEALSLQAEYADVTARRDHCLGNVSREHIQSLYGELLTLSASQVDRQAECRLSYFLKYGLRARERKEATVDPAEFGTYVHAVLENTARDVKELGGFQQVSLEQTLQIAKQHSDAYAAERFGSLGSQRVKYLLHRNMEELDLIVRELWEELSAGAYMPQGFEVHFGDGGELGAIQIPSQEMGARLEGYVDRVDIFRSCGRSYFRVVDYKTGKKDFDYCDVFNGVGLQMLLYLFALEQEGQHIVGEAPIAAGVQYFPARVPYVKLEGMGEDEARQRQENWVRQGLLLNDDLSLAAMDPQEQMPRLCCQRKNGTVVGDVASGQQLRRLKDYVLRILAGMVDEIASGKVDPNPYTRGDSHNACRYCPYGAVCNKATVEGRRNYKAMNAQRFWEEIEKEVAPNG